MHIIGASGHAKVIVDILELNGIKIEGIWDDNMILKSLFNYNLSGCLNDFVKLKNASSIIGVGSNKVRRRISKVLDCDFEKVFHPESVISKYSSIGIGTVVMANATINAGVNIGNHVIINTNCSIDHDCTIANYVHISPQAGLAGDVTICEGAHVGIGANVIQGITIGKWSVIGAGAVIIRDVPDFAVVVGNPAKIIRYDSF